MKRTADFLDLSPDAAKADSERPGLRETLSSVVRFVQSWCPIVRLDEASVLPVES